MLGFGPLGSAPIGGTPASVLSAAQGSFALTGVSDTFQIQESAAHGSIALTGEAAVLAQQADATAGSFALTGIAATFQLDMVEAFGSFMFTGLGVLFDPVEFAACGVFALTGVSTTFQTDLAPAYGSFVWTREPATLSIYQLFSSSGELLVPLWEDKKFTVPATITSVIATTLIVLPENRKFLVPVEDRVMIVRPQPGRLFVSSDKPLLRPARRRLEPV